MTNHEARLLGPKGNHFFAIHDPRHAYQACNRDMSGGTR